MEPKFRVYFVEPFDTVLRPFVIATAYSNAGGYHKAEWFLAIPDQEDSFFGQVTRFRAGGFEGGPVKLDEDFMLNEVTDQAKGRLRQYFFEKYQPQGLLQPFGTPTLVPEDEKSLVHYWLRGQCQAQITKILENTGCTSLQTFLNSLTRLPQIERRDL